MAKTNATPVTDPSPADLRLSFRDTLYTSRTLCIPGTNRTLPVVKATVDVSASDEQALSYLKSHGEFVPLE